MPIVNKPLIQYGVEEAMAAGMDNMAIITGRGKRALADHFDINYELEHQIAGTDKEGLLEQIRYVIENCTFSYTRQIEMKGLGHAILTDALLTQAIHGNGVLGYKFKGRRFDCGSVPGFMEASQYYFENNLY